MKIGKHKKISNATKFQRSSSRSSTTYFDGYCYAREVIGEKGVSKTYYPNPETGEPKLDELKMGLESIDFWLEGFVSNLQAPHKRKRMQTNVKCNFSLKVRKNTQVTYCERDTFGVI